MIWPLAVFAVFVKCLWMPQWESQLSHSVVEKINFAAGHLEAVVAVESGTAWALVLAEPSAALTFAFAESPNALAAGTPESTAVLVDGLTEFAMH